MKSEKERECFKTALKAGGVALAAGYLLVSLVALLAWRFNIWGFLNSYYELHSVTIPMIIFAILYLAGVVVFCTVLLLKWIEPLRHEPRMAEKNDRVNDPATENDTINL